MAKFFIDFEFSEGFHKSIFGKRRHHIDLISVGLIREDGKTYYAISNEYDYKSCNKWVQENVIKKMYMDAVHGDNRNHFDVHNFHKHYGKSNETIKLELLNCFGCWRDTLYWRTGQPVQVYGYYADYDWVLLCSLFGTMMDLPKDFPMYCIDLKQTFDETKYIGDLKSHYKYPKQENEHNALDDARWNLALYKFLNTL